MTVVFTMLLSLAGAGVCFAVAASAIAAVQEIDNLN